MKFALAKKINMTNLFDKDGKIHVVTAVEATPSFVVQVKNTKKDGYSAVQIGFGERAKKNIKKPQLGHMREIGNFAVLREYRIRDTDVAPVQGDKITPVELFAEGDAITVSGITKGKGFQGVVKRYNFKGGPRSHGQKHSEREPGSISGGTREGGRVPKGMRMAGRMGGNKITVKGLNIVAIDKDNSIIYIKGAVPGRKGTLLEIKG